MASNANIIYCSNRECGRRIVEIRREANGTAAVVREYHRPTRVRHTDRTDIDRDAVRRQIEEERRPERYDLPVGSIDLRGLPVTPRDVNDRVGEDLHVQCPYCYRPRVVPPLTV